MESNDRDACVELIMAQNGEDWDKKRREVGRNGSSDASTICDLNPHKRSVDFFWDKVNNIKWEGNECTRHGHLCEPIIAQFYEKVMECKLHESGYCVPVPAKNPNFEHGDDRWFGASLDRMREDDTVDVEIKAPYGKLYENNEVHPPHFAQLHVQMAVRNKTKIHYIAAKVSKDLQVTEYFIREVEFNHEFWRYIHKRMQTFSAHLLDPYEYGPPDVDLSANIDYSIIKTRLLKFYNN